MSVTTSFDSDLLVERVFNSLIGAMDLCTIYIGDQLGLYRSLDEQGPATSTELSDRLRLNERYVREWLEQQSVSGFLRSETEQPDDMKRVYSLPDGFADLYCDPENLSSIVPMAQLFIGVISPVEQLLDAFRTGKGVPYATYGKNTHQGVASFNRPQFRHSLTQEWLASMPDLVSRLQSAEPARIADIGMGQGWSSIYIAEAFPNVHVDGFDLDEASVKAARQNAKKAAVEDRVSFQARDAGDPELAGNYYFALAIECVHDMSDPVAVLRSMGRLVGKGGTVLIVDEKVADSFVAPGDDVERMMYGFSVLHCLAVGMEDQPSVGTGTVIRESTMRKYAAEAGFQRVEILPVANDFYRFYRMTA